MRRSPPRCASFRLAQSGSGAEQQQAMQRLTGSYHYPPARPEFLVLVLGSPMTEKARQNGVSSRHWFKEAMIQARSKPLYPVSEEEI